jgi:hypothetical protein
MTLAASSFFRSSKPFVIDLGSARIRLTTRDFSKQQEDREQQKADWRPVPLSSNPAHLRPRSGQIDRNASSVGVGGCHGTGSFYCAAMRTNV